MNPENIRAYEIDDDGRAVIDMTEGGNMNKRDKNKRLKGFGIPVELCVRYERMAGVKTGESPTPKQQPKITSLMVTALTVYASKVVLTSLDYKLIMEEVEANERNR